MEYFITDIEIKKVRHIENFKIPLSREKRKHLLITGKNGSGKTSVLEEIGSQIQAIYSNEKWEEIQTINSERLDILKRMKKNLVLEAPDSSQAFKDIILDREIEELSSIIIEKEKLFSNSNLTFSTIQNLFSAVQNGFFILVSFEANRESEIYNPDMISKFEFEDSYSPSSRATHGFLEYLVYLKTQQAFALIDGEKKEAEKIKLWFENFQQQLRKLFENEKLILEFDRKELNFKLKLYEDREPFDFSMLSSGYSAYLYIVSELIMRMEKHRTNAYDLQGIVLIDEIETHLHVSLQKQILPFLTNLFPKIQFIVTTHSPFVLNSIPDTVICDLENRTVLEDFSAYSYESIVEKYFGAEQYSVELQEKLNEYTELMQKDQLGIEEELNLKRLRAYLESIPYNMAPEIKIKFEQLELDRESEQL